VGEASEEEPDPEGDLEPNEDDHPQED
jgi:hypothetical protein